MDTSEAVAIGSGSIAPNDRQPYCTSNSVRADDGKGYADMGIETQAILPGHLTADSISGLLSADCKVKVAGIRSMHRSEYKVIEFMDASGNVQALNLFLNSYAASDYESVFTGDSTLATLEFSPSNFEVLSALAGATGGYVQRVGGEPWSQVAVRVA